MNDLIVGLDDEDWRVVKRRLLKPAAGAGAGKVAAGQIAVPAGGG